MGALWGALSYYCDITVQLVVILFTNLRSKLIQPNAGNESIETCFSLLKSLITTLLPEILGKSVIQITKSQSYSSFNSALYLYSHVHPRDPINKSTLLSKCHLSTSLIRSCKSLDLWYRIIDELMCNAWRWH